MSHRTGLVAWLLALGAACGGAGGTTDLATVAVVEAAGPVIYVVPGGVHEPRGVPRNALAGARGQGVGRRV